MIRVLGCIAARHDTGLVALAAVICMFGCYTTFSVLARATGDRRLDALWRALAGLTGGATIWATHFVAMLAFRPGMVVGYDVVLTLLSIMLAFSLTWAGFAITPQLGPWIGGAVAGSAIGVMHYVGMTAISAPARFHWDGQYVAVSIVAGICLGALALRCFSNRAELGWRLAAAAMMALAIMAMHFTAMAALTLEYDPRVSIRAGAVIAPDWLALAVALVTVVIAALALVSAAVDHHLAKRAIHEARRLRLHVAALESTKASLEATTAQLHDALAAAEASNQAKTQFLATMSHELRTPLNAIIGFADIMREQLYGPLGDARYAGYAKDISDSGLHLLDLISDVLDFSKIDAGRFELSDDIVDLRDCIAGVLHMVAGIASEAEVRLVNDLPASLPMVRADDRRLRQILLNLVSNAVKFTPRNGEVRVTASLGAAGIRVTVADTGIGIAPADIPRALEQFGQIDSSLARKYDGTGLGLPLAKRLIELHGGGLEIASIPGQGTRVTVVIPADRIDPGQ
jgi:signal transduction histidine kinase